MKISVIGSGAQGSSTVYNLVRITDAEVLATDVNLDVAKKAAERTKSDRVTTERADASNID